MGNFGRGKANPTYTSRRRSREIEKLTRSKKTSRLIFYSDGVDNALKRAGLFDTNESL